MTTTSPPRFFLALSVTTGSMVFGRIAHAGCPSPYNSASCDSICALSTVSSTNDTWTCDVSTSTNMAEVTTVEDYDASTPYESWGVYVTGSGMSETRHDFCCDLSATTVQHVIIIGSDYGDTLKFEWDNLAYNPLPTDSETPMAGYIYGGDGDDVMYGGAGKDDMAGGNDDDYMDGESDLDVLCGDAGTGDQLYDGDSYADVEKLWGEDSGDTATCTSSSTQIGPNTYGTGCSGTALPATRPAECP